MAIEKLKNTFNNWDEIRNKINEIIDGGGGGGGGSAEWGDIEGNIQNQTDLMSIFNAKQNRLTAGDGIQITNDIIRINIINDTLSSATTVWSSEEVKRRFDALSGSATIVVVDTLPADPVNNTLYYVATSTAGVYDIKLKSAGVLYDMGTTQIDLSSYYTKTEVDNLLATKQDTLVSGTNIKTINNESLLGSGNIDLDSSVETETTLWTGSQGQGSNITITLSDGLSNYKYLKFYTEKSTNRMIDTLSVSDINNSSISAQIILENSWDSNLRYVRFYKISNTQIMLENIVDTTLTKIVGVKVTPREQLTLTAKRFSNQQPVNSETGSVGVRVTLDEGYVLTGAVSSSEGGVFSNYISVISPVSGNPNQYDFLCWYTGNSGSHYIKVTAFGIKLS